MKGLELARAYYDRCGRPMLEKEFPALLPYLAVGLFGSGSECFGYDDTSSRDHDFEPGFCLFLPGEELVGRRSEFLLERAYAKLPKSFSGFTRSVLQPVGGARHGVFRTADFFLKKVGAADGALDLSQWLSIPEQALAEATNGVLFLDNFGEVTRIRERLRYYPEDVRLKRLAGHLLLMSQAGQYNYMRCLEHGETAAAQLAVTEFVRSAVSAVFLLNRRYQPFYKWCFRALRELPILPELAVSFEELLTTGNGQEEREKKAAMIEAVCQAVAVQLAAQDLCSEPDCELERLAYALNERIADAGLRNRHILAAV